MFPADEAVVDTVLSAYEEAGIRVVFAIAARDRAALDIAPLMEKELPEAIRKRLVGTSRPAKEELDFVTGQIARLGMNPRPLITWALAPSAPQRCSPELLGGPCRTLPRARTAGVHARVRNPAPGRGRACAVFLPARRAGECRADERTAEPRSWRLARRARHRHAGGIRRARRAQSDQQPQAQERRGADPRPLSRRRCGCARLRQLQLCRDTEHLHRHADAVPAAGGDRSGAASDQRRLRDQGGDARPAPRPAVSKARSAR